MTLNTELEDFRPLKIAYQEDQFTERPFKTGWGGVMRLTLMIYKEACGPRI